MTYYLSFFLALCVSAEAATYYVRKDGNDNNAGTGDHAGGAWLTIGGSWLFNERFQAGVDLRYTDVDVDLGGADEFDAGGDRCERAFGLTELRVEAAKGLVLVGRDGGELGESLAVGGEILIDL